MKNQRGVTLIELLVVIVVLGIIAAFSTIGISSLLSNQRKNSLVAETSIVLDAARISYTSSPAIWADNKATYQELIDEEYIQGLDTDPWGGTYDLEQSFVELVDLNVFNPERSVSVRTLNSTRKGVGGSLILRVTVVTSKATIGADGALDIFDKADVVLLDPSDEGFINRIVNNITGSVNKDLTGSNQADEYNISSGIKGRAVIDTQGGDDLISLVNDMKSRAVVNMGNGNDQFVVDGEVKGRSQLNMGDGNDTVTIDEDLRDRARVDTGAGNDTVTIRDRLIGSAVLDTGSGDDTVNANTMSNGTIQAGSGNDSVTINAMSKRANISMGDGDDSLTINDVAKNTRASIDLGAGNDTLRITDNQGNYHSLQRDRSTYNGGTGTDTLILPDVSEAEWNSYASSLFSGFETIILSDKTLNL